MRRIVVTSDWHLDAMTAGFARFDDVRASVDDSVNAAIDMGVILYAFTGDLCDPYVTRAHGCAEYAAYVAARCAAAGIPSRWLVGNHDVIEDGHGNNTMSALLGAEKGSKGGMWRVYDRPVVERFHGLDIIALPFTPRSHPYNPAEFIRTVAPGIREPAIVLAHLNIEGIKPGSETSELPRGRDVFFPLRECRELLPDVLLVCGHYHERQVFDGIHIPGSLERLTFGEEDNRPGFLVIEVPDA